MLSERAFALQSEISHKQRSLAHMLAGTEPVPPWLQPRPKRALARLQYEQPRVTVVADAAVTPPGKKARVAPENVAWGKWQWGCMIHPATHPRCNNCKLTRPGTSLASAGKPPPWKTAVTLAPDAQASQKIAPATEAPVAVVAAQYFNLTDKAQRLVVTIPDSKEDSIALDEPLTSQVNISQIVGPTILALWKQLDAPKINAIKPVQRALSTQLAKRNFTGRGPARP